MRRLPEENRACLRLFYEHLHLVERAAARKVAAQSAQGVAAQEQQARLQRVRANTPTSESLAEAREGAKAATEARRPCR